MDYILEKNNYWTLYKNEEERVLYFRGKDDLCFPYNTFHINHNACGLDSFYRWNNIYSCCISIKYNSQRIMFRKGLEKGTECRISTETVYDFKLNFIEKYITIYGKKICDYLSTKGKFEFVINNELKNISLLYQDASKGSLYLYTYNEDTQVSKTVSWNNIKSWNRLTFSYNNEVYESPFILVIKDNVKFVINLYTLKIKNITGTNYCFPIIKTFNYNDVFAKYSVLDDSIIQNDDVFILLDNSIYDENFVYVTSTFTYGFSTVVDVFYNFIAVLDANEDLQLNVFNFEKKHIREVFSNYIAGTDIKHTKLTFDPCPEYLDGVYFDLVDKKFKVDINVVKEKQIEISNKIRKTLINKKHYDYDYNDCSLLDALDGDPDAYWNID